MIPGDDAGSKVFRILQQATLPDDVEVIEGGIAGMRLLPLLEKSERVVFVDQVYGFGKTGDVIILDSAEVAGKAGPQDAHSGGLPYLLKILPLALEKDLPETAIIGIEGSAHEKSFNHAADIAIILATAKNFETDLASVNSNVIGNN